jgi:hypothetical protein
VPLEVEDKYLMRQEALKAANHEGAQT